MMKTHYYKILLMLYWVMCYFPFTANGQSSLSNTEKYPLLERTRYLIGVRPRAALQLLDSLERVGKWPVYKVCAYRMLAYDKLSMKRNAFLQGQKALHTKGLLSDTMAIRATYITISSLALDLDRINYANAYIAEGLDIAGKIRSSYLRAGLLSIQSELYYRQSLYKEADRLSAEAFRMLSTSDGNSERYLLSVLYGRIIRLSMSRKDYNRAIRIASARETLLDKMEEQAKLFYAIIDRQKAENYSLMAYCYALQHNLEQATHYYTLYQHTDYASTVIGRTLINNYLLSVKRYEEVLHNNRTLYHEVYLLDDTINLKYAELLEQTALAQAGLNNYQDAYVLEKRSRGIIDSLQRREGAGIAKILEHHFTEIQGKQQSTDASLNKNIIFITLLLLVSLFGVLGIRCLYNKKQKASQCLVETQACTAVPSDGQEAGSYVMSCKAEPVHTRFDAYSSLFKQFDDEVKQKRLFLDYQLGREDYMQLMKVDKNRFGGILKEFAGTNLNGYLNSLRLEHAVHLMKENPDMTIAELAAQCAIPGVSTFFRLFKEKYGVSPNEFKKHLVKGA